MPLSYRAKAIILGHNGYRTVLNALFPTRGRLRKRKIEHVKLVAAVATP